MSLRTSRAYEPAEVFIDRALCNDCLLCTKVCDLTLRRLHDKVVIDQSRLWGCIGCGQCVAVCPEDAIRVEGRDFKTSDAFPIAPRDERADYSSLLNLLHALRSVRRFRPRQARASGVTRPTCDGKFATVGRQREISLISYERGQGTGVVRRPAPALDRPRCQGCRPFTERLSLARRRAGAGRDKRAGG